MSGSPQSPNQMLYEISMGYIRTKSLYAVAKLQVADNIEKNGSSIANLATTVGADENALYRVMRLLAGLGVFREESDRIFSHTPMSECLRADHEKSERQSIIFSAEEQYEAFEEILHSVRTEQPGFERRYKESIFAYLKSHDDVHKSFQSSMRARTKSETAVFLNAYDFSSFRKIVDVGGGDGTLLSGILTSCPDVSGILFDRINTIEIAREGAGGALPRCELVAGDFFEDVPKGGDLYILKRIIHDWYDKDAALILRNCRRAMEGKSKLLIMERVVGPPNQPSMANHQDIIMMVIVGGMERRETEYRSLLGQADLKLDRVVETATGVSILEASAI